VLGVSSWILCRPFPAYAETVLEWAKARGAAEAKRFEDDVGTLLPRSLPKLTERRAWGSFALGGAVVRSELDEAAQTNTLGLLDVFGKAWTRTYEPVAGSLGQSWLVGARLAGGLGAGSQAAFADLSAGIGPWWTLTRSGEGVTVRLFADFSQAIQGGSETRQYGASVPVGFGSSWAELGVAPKVGALEVLGRTSGSPWLWSSYARLFSRVLLFELEQVRTVTGPISQSARVLACTRLRWLGLCSRGEWLVAESAGAKASWAQAAIELGLGWGYLLRERDEAPQQPVYGR
jgi:hypothetical protein